VVGFWVGKYSTIRYFPYKLIQVEKLAPVLSYAFVKDMRGGDIGFDG
jgi:hypothetical protein